MPSPDKKYIKKTERKKKKKKHLPWRTLAQKLSINSYILFILEVLGLYTGRNPETGHMDIHTIGFGFFFKD